MPPVRAEALELVFAAAVVAVFASAAAALTGRASRGLLLTLGSILAVAAAVTAGWAVVLHLVARRDALRSWLLRVLVANAVAAAAIIGLAISRPRDGVSLLLLAVAVEVALFATSQALALRRLAHS